MKKLTILAAGLFLLVPSLAFSDSFQLRLGYFMPGASSNIGLYPDSLWAIEFDQMSFKMEDFRGSFMGIGYERFLGKNLSIALTLDSYSKSRLGYYMDYVVNELEDGYFAFPYELYYGDDILHSFKVSATPLQLSFKLSPLGRKTRLIPFIGGGAGLTFWSVRMYGEMIDFAFPAVYPDPVLGNIDIYPVEGVYAKESGTAFGYHAFAGFQFPIGYRATIEAEARYHWAKARFDEWFLGFEDFDLGGLALSVGISYWF
jgi:hypothetical protein